MKKAVVFCGAVFLAGAFLITSQVALAEPNLVAHWKFEEGSGTIAYDSAGSNNGVLVGNPNWVAGKVGACALELDGDGDYVEIPDDNSLDIIGQMSICAWVKPENVSNLRYIVSKMPSGSANDIYPGNYLFQMQSGGKLRLLHQTTTGNTYATYLSDSGCEMGMWHHVAVTIVQGGTVIFYIDGFPAGSQPQTGTFGIVNNNSLRIGTNRTEYSYFYGLIDDIRIYNRVITDEEVEQLYMGGLVKAFAPNPAKGAAGVDPDIIMRWSPGIYVASHNVYLGTDHNDINSADTNSPEYKGNYDVNNYDPCGLEIMTTYYWRVDEVNEPNLWKGDIWSFETAGPSIGVSATDFVFDANEGGANPAAQIFTIRNSGAGTLNWQISESCSWLSVYPISGSSTGEADEVTLSVDVSGLGSGVYDCELTISDPNAANNPCNVNVTLNLIEVWRDYIVFPDDSLASEVIFEGDPRWVKFTIKLDDPNTVYFQNSKRYPFHYNFATEWLEPFIGMSVPEYYAVTFYDVNQQASLGAVILPPTTGEPPEPEFAEYGIQFIRYDAYTKEEIAAMFMAVKNSVIADPCVTAFYFPSYEQLQVAEENQAWFESQGIPIGSIAQWIEGNICYSEGWAIGEVKYFPGDQIQDAYINGDLLPEDILLTDGVPAEVPFVAGIITLSPSTQNSHVAILSRTYGIPFVYLAAESDVNTVWQLVNDLTLLCVQEESGICSVQLKDAMATFTPEEIDELFAMKEPVPLDVAPMAAYGSYGANTDNLLPEDIEHFGGKAANYGMLRQSIPDSAPIAAAISFDVWNEFMDQALTPIESVIIPAHGYVVFWADDQQEQGARHASFKLSKSGEDIGLFDTDGSLIDGLSFGSQATDVSYGRTPDGNDSWAFFSGGNISPNAPNPGGTGVTGGGLFINEFMADNDNIVADEYGQYDDWVEIYNSGSTSVDMGGMYLTDDLEDPTKWMISVGISGSTLREEIANRLSGYTYPVSDLAGLSAELAAIRNIIKNPNITTFSPQLQAGIIAFLQDPNYGFDPNKNIRFRSSTNAEDAEKFTGAGLYDSYSGCLADDLDGDESGPCSCDPNESNERGVFRAIRKVMASFYNDNAYLERLRRDVNETQVGMAMLVHHSFPDEIELANGVATMEKKLSPAHWDIKLVTQKGATPVTNPEEGALPEEVSVYLEEGEEPSMVLIRQSNLVILGEKVMEWQADYNELTDLLAAAAEEFETVTGKTEYILDFEYKKVAPGGAALPEGGIEVDQIREIPPLDIVSATCPSFDYNCTCTGPGSNIFAEYLYEEPVSGVSIETSYCLNCPEYMCKVYDLSSWCRTVIRGYTTRPVVLLSSASQSYSAEWHNWCEDFLFTPSLEPGMDQCLLRQLRAKDIRVIHLDNMTDCGEPYIETFGFGAGPYYIGDINWDGDVDMADYARFAQRWLDSDCGECGGADLNCDEEVDLEDMAELVNNWLAG